MVVKTKMINIITAFIVTTCLYSGVAVADAPFTEFNKDNFISALEPALPLPEALAIAQDYIKTNNIDISKHYLDNIRLLQASSFTEGKHWILTWALKVPADGGQIIIIIGMDKEVKVMPGL